MGIFEIISKSVITLFALDELGRREDSGGLGDLDDERCDPPHHGYIPTERPQAAR
ncbi:hypothetical protein [Streptomyces sp. NPDC051921]|uniref:hypothetical protein n=1 Tax=Streptomyces sp. NPDC051921 TaxID=3155806 RepID=UPI00342A3D5A